MIEVVLVAHQFNSLLASSIPCRLPPPCICTQLTHSLSHQNHTLKQTPTNVAVVFFPRLASLANRTTLAVSLGLAAGVMLYISLVDIYYKSVDGFVQAGHDDSKSFMYATLSYFGGSFIMLFLDKCVDWLLQWEMNRSSDGDGGDGPGKRQHEPVVAGIIAGDAANPGEELDRMREQFQKRFDQENPQQKEEEQHQKSRNNNKQQSNTDVERPGMDMSNQTDQASDSDASDTEVMDTLDGRHSQPLRQMGFAMLLAIAIHNFPEGMVTYLAYVEESAVGIALAVGIAVHNIPEGLCVSMPLFYATNRRWYSFWWGTISGLTEPLGALLAWLVLQGDLGGNANGILFGIVSGMMSIISIQELLPNAHKYARNTSTVTHSFLLGAFLIAVSLMLFSV